LKKSVLILLIGAFAAISTNAFADQQFYLVGMRHAYKLGGLPDPHESERQQIEEEFSAAIKDAQAQFDATLESIWSSEDKAGGNPNVASRDLMLQTMEQATTIAAEARDARLKKIYSLADYVQSNHPELKMDQDGAYMVMGVDTGRNDQYTDATFYQPYPTYANPAPYNLNWGAMYQYNAFLSALRQFRAGWGILGVPVFSTISVNGRIYVVTAPLRRVVVLNRTYWTTGMPPAITVRDRQNFSIIRQQQIKSGLIQERQPTAPVAPSTTREEVKATVPSEVRHEAPQVEIRSNPPVTRVNSGSTSGGIQVTSPATSQSRNRPATGGGDIVIKNHRTAPKEGTHNTIAPPTGQGNQGSNYRAPGGPVGHPNPPINRKKKKKG